MKKLVKTLAAVEPVESENPHGEFDVILSTESLDRDGDTLRADEWKMPLPEHITFDSDHGMSVESTVGSGRPFINDKGQLQVRGTYASTQHAQNVRALVNEGHIKTTSVAFMTSPSTEKDGKPQRELLNGAFVAIPSNRDALVISSKSAVPQDDSTDHTPDANEMTQAIHDAAVHLGADCSADAATGAADGANKSLTDQLAAAEKRVAELKAAVAAQTPGTDTGTLATTTADGTESTGATTPADTAPDTAESVAVRARALAFALSVTAQGAHSTTKEL